MEVWQGSASAAKGEYSSSFWGKCREMRLERHLGKVVEHFEYEVVGFGLYSVVHVES